MYSDLADHPEVAMALRTGYAHRRSREKCEVCGGAAEVYGRTEGLRCRACAIETFDALSVAEQLEVLGFEMIE